MNHSFKILKRNNFFYNYFVVKKILQLKDKLTHEELVERIVFIARFAWRNHSGYFSDGRIENILWEYGQNLESYIDNQDLHSDIASTIAGNKPYTILHVATELGDAGGHTRMLFQLVKRYKDSNHIIVLTDQSKDNVPVLFKNSTESNVTIISLKAIKSLFYRAYILRQISSFSEKVILHHHPYDVVPIMAFSCDKCPPVLIENHAHSWFWLGSSVADLVYTYSEFHRNFTLKKRPIDNVYLLRSTDSDDVDTTFNWDEKGNIKKRLGLEPDSICIITVGTAEKFIPNANYDFFKTANKIIRRFKNVEIFVIGIDDANYIQKKYELDPHKIHFIGAVIDLRDYYKAADIYLESLPQPSFGVTMTSAPIGLCCPLLKYGPGNIFNMLSLFGDKLYGKYVGYLKTEEEYIDKLEFLINTPDIRRKIAEDMRESYVNYYSSQSIYLSIKEMLEQTDDMKHFVRKIPDGIYYHDEDSAEIAGNSELQNYDDVFNLFRKYLNNRNIIIIAMLMSIRVKNGSEIFRYLFSKFKNRLNSIGNTVANKWLY